MIGVIERDTASGIHVVGLDFIADPAKRSPQWERETRRGIDERTWRKEYLRDWSIATGLGVFSEEFVRDWHVAKQPLMWDKHRPMFRGWDFGLTPACVFGQQDSMGRLNVLHCMVTWDGRGDMRQQGIERFAPVVVSESNLRYPGAQWYDWADPAGWSKSQSDEKTCVDIMRVERIYPQAGPVSFASRKQALVRKLTEAAGGRAALLVDPNCRMLIEGFEGAYKYEEIGETGRFKETVEKNAWSHPMDALSYMIGALYMPPKRESDEGERRKPAKRDRVTGY